MGESGKGLNWQMSILPGLLDCYAPQLVISDYIAPLYVFRDGATRPKSSGGSVSAGPPSIQWESLWRTHPVTDALIWKNLSKLLFKVLRLFAQPVNLCGWAFGARSRHGTSRSRQRLAQLVVVQRLLLGVE